MIKVCVRPAAIDTRRATLFHARIYHSDRERCSTQPCTSSTHVVAKAFDIRWLNLTSEFSTAIRHYSDLFAVRGFVSFLVGCGLFSMREHPCARMAIVARVAIGKVAICACAITREVFNRLRQTTSAALFHVVSITRKYNAALLQGWKVLRATTGMAPEIRDLLVAALK